MFMTTPSLWDGRVQTQDLVQARQAYDQLNHIPSHRLFSHLCVPGEKAMAFESELIFPKSLEHSGEHSAKASRNGTAYKPAPSPLAVWLLIFSSL